MSDAVLGRLRRSAADAGLAVVAVTVGILVLLLLRGQPTGDPGGTPVVAQPTAGVGAPPAQSPAGGPASEDPTADDPTVADPSADPSTQTGTVPSKPALTVFADGQQRDLANRAAQALRRAGWQVAVVDTLGGRFRSTTVYYPPGDEATARALAAAFPAIQRVLPRFAALPGRGLTVVVTDDLSG